MIEKLITADHAHLHLVLDLLILLLKDFESSSVILQVLELICQVVGTANLILLQEKPGKFLS